MQQSCHRCGGDLPSGPDVTPFCPHCGSPQLYLQDYDRPILAPDSIPQDTTGAAPPPPPQQIDWQTAIRCAALVSAVSAILSLLAAKIDILSVLSTLTILSASLITVGLYQRRRPGSRMDASIGARIGLVAGLILVVALTLAGVISGLVARFVFHSMSTFDIEITRQLHSQLDRMAAANPLPPELVHYFLTPDFRAGMMLSGIAFVAVMLLLFSTLGGAVSGLLRTRRTPVV